MKYPRHDVLVVDDRRLMPFPARYVRTSAGAIARLSRDRPLSQLWLDHDLGGDDTGMRVADWMAQQAFEGHPVQVHQIFVHSANGPGAQRLMLTLERWYPQTRRTPAPMTTRRLLRRLLIRLLEPLRRCSGQVFKSFTGSRMTHTGTP